MRYLVTYIVHDIRCAFYTEWFDPENNFGEGCNMVVFDLKKNIYYDDNLTWSDIKIDSL